LIQPVDFKLTMKRIMHELPHYYSQYFIVFDTKNESIKLNNRLKYILSF